MRTPLYTGHFTRSPRYGVHVPLYNACICIFLYLSISNTLVWQYSYFSATGITILMFSVDCFCFFGTLQIPTPRRRNLPFKDDQGLLQQPPVPRPRPRAATAGAMNRPQQRGRSPSPTPPQPATAPETNGQMHPKPHPRGFTYTTPGAAKQPAVAADAQLAALLARQSEKLHDN